MKIVICGSIDFTPKIKEVANVLTNQGHEVDIPVTSQRILNGELTLKESKKEKQKSGDGAFRRKIKEDVIKRYYKIIGESDALLVLNLEKNEIENYIGGNTFLEMGFAHVLGKPIYLYNGIPDVSYKEEILAMQPVVINGDISKINLS
jgi:nucleoside 2-deoxyribosyltransferase